MIFLKQSDGPCLSTRYHINLSASFTTDFIDGVHRHPPLASRVTLYSMLFSHPQAVIFTQNILCSPCLPAKFGSNISFSESFLDSSQLKPFSFFISPLHLDCEVVQDKEREIYRGNNGQSLWTWNISIETLGKGGFVAESTPDVEVRWGEVWPLCMEASSWMTECGEHVWKEWELSLDRSQVTNNNILRAKDNIQ